MLLLLLGCNGFACTQMYAPNMFTLTMDVAAEGTWARTLTAGGKSTTCSVTLPDASDATCTGAIWSAEVIESDAGWTLTTTLIPPSDATDVTLTVTLDGEQVADETFTPDWNVSEPNGEGCGETITAGEEIDLTGV